MTAKDLAALRAMIEGTVDAAVERAMAGVAADEPTESAVVKVTTKPKSRKGSQSTKTAPKASAARRKRGERAEEWIVRESWKGEQASTRMLGFAVKSGVSAAILKRGDKFEVSQACGTALKLPVVIRD